MDFGYVDDTMRNDFKDLGIVYLIRTGSSLHPESFTDSSDIDYIMVLDSIDVKKFNRKKVSNPIHLEREKLINFFWKTRYGAYKGHDVNLHIYTYDKFLRYVMSRSGIKMHILRDYKMVAGSEDEWIMMRDDNPPNELSVDSDRRYLLSNSWNRTGFLWAWRSVIFRETGKWVTTKKEINEYIMKNHKDMIKADIGEQRDYILERIDEF